MNMNPLSMFLGAWIIIDGLGSMILYRKQAWYEHAVRVLRIIAGILVIFLL
jgi:hypothetical protein